jgi:hypothetical protein
VRAGPSRLNARLAAIADGASGRPERGSCDRVQDPRSADNHVLEVMVQAAQDSSSQRYSAEELAELFDTFDLQAQYNHH